MTVYRIAGTEVTVPTSAENAELFANTFGAFRRQLRAGFDGWYDSQKNCEGVAAHYEDMLNAFITPAAEKGVEILRRQGVYDLDARVLTQRYLPHGGDRLAAAVQQMTDEVRQVEQARQEAVESRRQRTAGRPWAAALPGSNKTAANVVNATAGAFQSLGAMLGNVKSSISATIGKSDLYGKYRPVIREALEALLEDTIQAVQRCLQDCAGMDFTNVIDGRAPDADAAQAVLDGYRQGTLPEAERRAQLLAALACAPKCREIYEALWLEAGDESGDLEKMSEFFGVPLSGSDLTGMGNDACRRIFMEHCADFADENSPIFEAADNEDLLELAQEEMTDFCAARRLDPGQIKALQTCKALLAAVDLELRSAYGVVYPTREEAGEVRADRDRFYAYLEGKNLDDPQVFEALRGIRFASAAYRDALEQQYAREQSLRDSRNAFSNLKQLCGKYFPDGQTALGPIEVAREDAAFASREAAVRKALELPEDETSMMLVSLAPGAWAGILLTGRALYFYNRTLLAVEHCRIACAEIRDVEFSAANRFTFYTADGPQEAALRPGLDIQSQTGLFRLIQETVQLLHNLPEYELQHLRDIHDGSRKCICGRILPEGVEVCPFCHKVYTEDGVFVDTVFSEYCGHRIRQGKRFCSKCGRKVGEEPGEEPLYRACPSCRSRVHLRRNYCYQCGKPLPAMLTDPVSREETVPCSQCGSPVPVHEGICRQCGTQMIWRM